MMKRREDQGFGLIELMVAVAITSILAAIGLSTFRAFTVKAKTSEAVNNLALIRKLQQIYKSEYDTYATCPSNPNAWAAGPGASTPRSWDANIAAWDRLGFEPDGVIRYQYRVTTAPGSYTATATGDIDEDTQTAIFIVSNDPASPAAAGYPKPLKVGDDY
jgi:prepilin-type N-terminal cleavage/methylation domain-containing protein